MSSLKIEKIYNKIHMIEKIVDECCIDTEGKTLTLEQLQEFALNLGALQMVNLLPHMDLVPVQTQNRINLLMNSAKKELVKQFADKIADYENKERKTEEAIAHYKAKEMQLLEVTAELAYAKSALKSGEVKDMLQKLPGLLMETSQKTLIKEEAALLNEHQRLKERRVSKSRGREASLNNTSSVMSSIRVTAR